MPYMKYHFAALTSGTKITATTSGFITPPGANRIGHIHVDGADHEALTITFPLGDHKYNEEKIYVGCEIAEHTRTQGIFPFPYGMTWCGWPTHEGQQLDITPDDGTSSDNSVIYVEYLYPEDTYGIYGAPALHWQYADEQTYGTTTTGTRILEKHSGAGKLMWVGSHAAGSTAINWTYQKGGEVQTVPGNHAAIDAAITPIPFWYINRPCDNIYAYYDTDLYTGTGVIAMYCGFEF